MRDLSWIRTNMSKLDKELRSELLAQYRSVYRIPCIFQRLYGCWQNRFRRLPVIVQTVPTEERRNLDSIGSLLLKYCPQTQGLEIIQSFAAKLNIPALQDLVGHSAVKKIYLDREVGILLSRAVPAVKAEQVWSRGYTGKNVTIAVLDTGLSPHPDFLLPEKRIKVFLDLRNKGISRIYDDNGHGTHCAGAALGNGYNSGGKYRGPAFEADLIAIKVLNKNGFGSASQVIQGLDWCLANREKHNIRIISLSLGYKATGSYLDDPLCQSVERLWEEGVVVCAAAGNDGPEEKTINSPGIHPAIITVGASAVENYSGSSVNTVAGFSSRGPTPDGLPKPDFLAPGKDIISARAKGSLLDKFSDKTAGEEWYLPLSGTSMATPICAGIIAQILEACPHLTPGEIKDILRLGCVQIPNFNSNSQGSGHLNALASFEKASENNPLSIFHPEHTEQCLPSDPQSFLGC